MPANETTPRQEKKKAPSLNPSPNSQKLSHAIHLKQNRKTPHAEPLLPSRRSSTTATAWSPEPDCRAVEEVVVVEVGVLLGRESMRTGERERELWLVKNLGKRRHERSESISTVRGSSRSWSRSIWSITKTMAFQFGVFFIFLTGRRRVFILYTLSSRFLRLMFHFTIFFIFLFLLL